jgi:hypothetical protein
MLIDFYEKNTMCFLKIVQQEIIHFHHVLSLFNVPGHHLRLKIRIFISFIRLNLLIVQYIQQKNHKFKEKYIFCSRSTLTANALFTSFAF